MNDNKLSAIGIICLTAALLALTGYYSYTNYLKTNFCIEAARVAVADGADKFQCSFGDGND